MIELDEYETDILQSVENEEWQSRGNLDDRIKKLQSYIKNKKIKRELINYHPHHPHKATPKP